MENLLGGGVGDSHFRADDNCAGGITDHSYEAARAYGGLSRQQTGKSQHQEDQSQADDLRRTESDVQRHSILPRADKWQNYISNRENLLKIIRRKSSHK